MKKLIITLALLASATLVSRAAETTENWQKHCAKCHGNDGKGDTKMGKKAGVKDMTAADFQGKLNDEHAFKAVRDGVKEDGKEKMKPNKDLSDAEIKALIAHVRTLKK